MSQDSLAARSSLRFSPGNVVATPAALALLRTLARSPFTYLTRHLQGDWGELCAEDRRCNEDALENGYRIFSSYDLQTRPSAATDDMPRLWIITEADRSVTTLLLPKDY
jgi:hypothetical protein